MSSSIISVDHLGKSYVLGHHVEREQYTALRDVIAQKAQGAASKLWNFLRGVPLVQGDTFEEFWALQDVSFEVQEGEVLGIIGHNGAGKSTLLKILSRITDPSRGRVALRGRVASLLEVGTGFHPELTGRENIFLNGAILGMARREIAAKFDEIVSFAEVERFLDTPVKRYSSGMYVRLAFAVAAHLDPEILVVDEVLAVGDAQFQRKCLGKMQDVSRQQGRTVLFVSHNMAAIKTLCTRAICLEKGNIVADDLPDPVLQRYLHAGSDMFDGVIDPERPRQYQTGEVRFTRIRLRSPENENRRSIDIGQDLMFSIEYEVRHDIANLILELGILDSEGRQISQSRWPRIVNNAMRADVGTYTITLVSQLTLMPGSYSVLLAAHHSDGTTIDWVERALDFEVLNSPPGSTTHYPWTVRGIVDCHDRWSEPIPANNTLAPSTEVRVWN